jgi:cytoskeletal protein CcmA (bactofilin family)
MFNKKANERDDMPGATSVPPTASESSGASAATPTPSSNPAPSSSSSSTSNAPTSGAVTVLAEGCKFTGTADVSGTFRIEGKAEGTLKAADDLVVGKTGDVKAEVTARRATLNGKLRGKIEATDRVELQTGSDVEADIKAKNMVMEDGVQYRGNLQIGS